MFGFQTYNCDSIKIEVKMISWRDIRASFKNRKKCTCVPHHLSKHYNQGKFFYLTPLFFNIFGSHICVRGNFARI